jgi:hypothetical protein
MSNFYVSSTAWTNITPWGTSPFAASATVTLGQITRQSAPATDNERAFRVSTAGTLGTLEPTWTLTNNGTTNESGHGGTAVWTECTGQEAHQHDNGTTNTWTAPGARVSNVTKSGNATSGDTIFLSSDHAQTQSSGTLTIALGTATSPVRIISVDRTKSVPPLPADPNPVSGASITNTSTSVNSFVVGAYLEIWGVTMSSGAGVQFGQSSSIANLIMMNGTVATSASAGSIGFIGNAPRLDFQNVTFNFNNTNQSFKLQAVSGGMLRWRNGSGLSALSGTVPTNLFSVNTSGQLPFVALLDGLDFSSLGSNTVIINSSSTNESIRFFASNCKLGSGFVWSPSTTSGGPISELVNCDSGNTNYKNLKYDGLGGALTTDTSVTMTGGATDGVTAYAHKMVSSSNHNIVSALESFALLKWNSTTGSAVTAAVQLLTTSTLKMSDVWLEAEYLSDSGSPLGSFVTTFANGNVLDGTTPLSSGTGVWNNSPASPVTLQMSTTFTPNQVGWIRAFVKLAKTSTTVWINPAFQ